MPDIIKQYKEQKTFVMVKPDGVQRGLLGEIIKRFEDRQLRVAALKMIRPTVQDVRNHYPMEDKEWVTRLGKKSLGTFADANLDPKKYLGTDDEYTIGTEVVQWLTEYIGNHRVVAMVIEWPNAVDMCRKIVGNTIPHKADIGSIRGDFSVDTPLIANIEKRSIHNLIHASETAEEAANEIALWFGSDEVATK